MISRTSRWIDGDYGGEVERGRTKDGTRQEMEGVGQQEDDCYGHHETRP